MLSALLFPPKPEAGLRRWQGFCLSLPAAFGRHGGRLILQRRLRPRWSWTFLASSSLISPARQLPLWRTFLSRLQAACVSKLPPHPSLNVKTRSGRIGSRSCGRRGSPAAGALENSSAQPPSEVAVTVARCRGGEVELQFPHPLGAMAPLPPLPPSQVEGRPCLQTTANTHRTRPAVQDGRAAHRLSRPSLPLVGTLYVREAPPEARVLYDALPLFFSAALPAGPRDNLPGDWRPRGDSAMRQIEAS